MTQVDLQTAIRANRKRFGYARVSTSDQDLTIQHEQLAAAGCSIIRSEKATGTKREGREQLQILLDFIQEGDVLVVTRLDRLARSISDLITISQNLEAKGAALQVLHQNIETETPAGRLFFAIMGAIGQFETELRRERQMEGIAKAKAEGAYKGRRRQVAPSDVKALRAQGVGASAIARQLGCSRKTVYRAIALQSISLTRSAPIPDRCVES
jgi:DNA invertase Pin-like site-specific DNA recombinase